MALGGSNLEYWLRQKLTLMANAAACVSSVKAQLRNNSERTRKDICNAIDHQLSCIRAREQELILNLEEIVAEKEQKLYEQQEQFNQAIGACQQSLELLRNKDPADLESMIKMLFKLNTIVLRPKETPEICFEYDPSDLRRGVASFGNVCAVDPQYKSATESLPLDVEHYEDGGLLSHKSVLRLSSNSSATPPSAAAISKDRLPSSDSINYWLAQGKSSPEKFDDDNFGFEFVRDRLESISGSSIEVINNKENSTAPTEIFNNHFSELDDLPKSHWLLNETPINIKPILPDLSKLVMEMELEGNEMSFNSNESTLGKLINRKRTANIPQVQTTSKVLKNETNFNETNELPNFAFEKVIKSIQSSDNKQWLLERKSSLPTALNELSVIEQTSMDQKPTSEGNLCNTKLTEQKIKNSPFRSSFTDFCS